MPEDPQVLSQFSELPPRPSPLQLHGNPCFCFCFRREMGLRHHRVSRFLICTFATNEPFLCSRR